MFGLQCRALRLWQPGLSSVKAAAALGDFYWPRMSDRQARRAAQTRLIVLTSPQRI